MTSRKGFFAGSLNGLPNYPHTVTDNLVNGIPVLCESIPFFSSVSLGIFFTSGSRNESAENSGLFHFLEHLVFKGTVTRDQRAIATLVDQLGGRIDAYTSHETTCYSFRVVAERLEEAFELVADITLRSTFPPEEVERERQVILEEIRMSQDSPAAFVHEQIYPALFGNHPMGRPITGDAETVARLTRSDIMAARDRCYRPPCMVVTACGGAFEAGRIEELVDHYFGNLAFGPPVAPVPPPEPQPGITRIYPKKLEQVHLMFAGPGLCTTSPKRVELAILDSILGGGVSSRLFQKVREEQGLAYSVSSFFEQYEQTGLIGFYAACSPEKLERTWETIISEIEAIRNKPPTSEEVLRAKQMESDNIRMSFESPSSRMGALADKKIYFDTISSLEEALKEVEAITPERVQALAEELSIGGQGYSVVAVGPLGTEHEKALRHRRT